MESRAPHPPAFDGHGKTVLLVDDEQPVRNFLREVFDLVGFDVLVASGGHEALELARANAGGIDLLITDVVMPGMDGRELAQRFAAICPEAKVLFVSGFPERFTRDQADAPTPLLQKPFTASDLTARVAGLLGSDR